MDDKKDAFRDLLKRNRFVFLGMTASRKQSVAGMQTCIEETNRSGIRFVYVYRLYRSYITTNLFVIQTAHTQTVTTLPNPFDSQK